MPKFSSGYLIAPLIIVVIFSCGKTHHQTKLNISTTNSDSTKNLVTLPADTIIKTGKINSLILSPSNYWTGDILMLPGWNFSKEKTCNETSFCDQALAAGYRLVMPDMHRSTYATHYFPETRNDYRSFPTLTWVTDTLITELKKTYGIFSGKNNIIYGISTGARGAALVHLRTGKLFQKVVLLSGDYDQTQNHKDNLMINTYGNYTEFSTRWKETDNPTNEIRSWSAEVYIAHGLKDNVVDPAYSVNFADTLNKIHPELRIELHLDSLAGHDFRFWENETNRILEFLKKKP